MRTQTLTKVFLVKLNDREVGRCPGTKADAKAWIRARVLSTHMGQWSRLKLGGYQYATTIGQYYTFEVIYV